MKYTILILAAGITAAGLAANATAQNVSDSAAAGNAAEVCAPYDGRLNFQVLRKGKPFGHHNWTFTRNGERCIVEVDAHLEVSFGPITPFEYDHKVREVWRDGVLQSLQSSTLKDGETYELSVTREGDQLMIDGAEYQGPAPGDLVPSTYWNKALVQQDGDAKMLNTETGKVMDVAITEKGAQTVNVAGETVSAEHYLLNSDIDLNLMYDGEKLVKLTFTARDQPIEYVLQDG